MISISKSLHFLLTLFFFFFSIYKEASTELFSKIILDADIIKKALSALYVKTGGEKWEKIDKWDFEINSTIADYGSWDGIKYDNSSGALQIDLSDNNLCGTIPDELTNLKCLTHLNLSDNDLSGTIPDEISNLKFLTHLNLSKNKFRGSIPSTLWSIKKLKYVNLSFNQLSGLIFFLLHSNYSINQSTNQPIINSILLRIHF